jgi:pyrroloquinoline quinone biosynthesis protein D
MKRRKKSRRCTLRLAPGRELRTAAADGYHVLTGPSGPVQLNDVAASILALCDGTRTEEDIVARVLQMSHERLAGDIREFLSAAARRGWIVQR